MNKTLSEKKEYLLHLQGIRAIAIFAVIWFHFSQSNGAANVIPALPNGFLGVDVFFVIMGYLLIKGFCRPEFVTPARYFGRRVLRLFPALLVTVIVSVIVGVFIFDFEDNTAMGKVGVASLYGWSNVVLKSITTGYFAEDASMNPFLHTWYISVTFQLLAAAYLLYLALRRLRKSTIMVVAVLLGIASLAYGQLGEILPWLLGKQVALPWAASYYDTFPRVWELLAGGSLVLIPACKKSWLNNILATVGLFLVLFPALSPDSWVAKWAILAVIGTMLLIYSVPGTWLARLLENKPIVWLGTCSYSLYLVHMPLYAFYKGWIFSAPGDAAQIILLLLSFILGTLLWWGVEKRKCSWACFAGLYAVAFAIVLACKVTDGFKESVNKASNSFDVAYCWGWKHEPDWKYAEGMDVSIMQPAFHSRASEFKDLPPLKRIGDASLAPSFVLVGDSFMYHTAGALEVVCRRLGVSGLMLDSIIIPFWNRAVINNEVPFYRYTEEKAKALLDWFKAYPEIKTVICAQQWNRFKYTPTDWSLKKSSGNIEADMQEFVEQVRACGKELVFLEPTPCFQSAGVKKYVRWRMRHRLSAEEDYRPEYESTLSAHRENYAVAIKLLNQLEEEGKAKIIRLEPFFWPDGNVCRNVQDGYVICGDTEHLTDVVAEKMGGYFTPQLEQILSTRKLQD